MLTAEQGSIEVPEADEIMTVRKEDRFPFRHRKVQDELVRFALRELDGRRHKIFLQHLAECPWCRREVSEIYMSMSILCLSATGPVPPAQLRDRLLAALH
jgi:hypothetical protein